MNRRSRIPALPVRALLAALISTALLGGCSTPQVQDYAGQAPVLELRDYFNGTLDAYGIFTDRAGKVVNRPQAFLNEAKLTQLALSVRFAAA